MNYTYRDLLEALQEMSSDELDMSVTVYDRGQEAYHKLNYAGKCEGDDKVNADQPILIINDPDETVSECPPLGAFPSSLEFPEFPDVRACEIWLEFADGSTLTTDDFIDMDKCIETQIRDTFEDRSVRFHSATKSGSAIVNFKWRELGI
jgi:hypothetical protein